MSRQFWDDSLTPMKVTMKLRIRRIWWRIYFRWFLVRRWIVSRTLCKNGHDERPGQFTWQCARCGTMGD